MELRIESLVEVVKSTKALESLVMDNKHRDQLLELVNQHENRAQDIVAGKSGALFVFLHGPPGCGKTLTSEAIASYTNKPLYDVSTGQLGNTADTILHHFRLHLSRATKWKAIVQLDEIDALCEKREKKDLSGNNILAVLLREMEYFEGIIFTTSNRSAVIDPAMLFRMKKLIHVPQLNADARSQIWKQRVIQSVSYTKATPMEQKRLDQEIDYKALSEKCFNGRVIATIMYRVDAHCSERSKPLTQALLLDFATQMYDELSVAFGMDVSLVKSD